MGPSMKEKLSRYFFYFMLYSIMGWIYEVFLEVVIYHWGYSNRGVLFGPYCVIYGVGALILLFSLQGLKRRSIRLGPVPITPVLVFVAIVVITTVVELIGSYIMEWTTGRLAVGLPPLRLQLPGPDRPEPQPPLRRGRNDPSLRPSASAGAPGQPPASRCFFRRHPAASGAAGGRRSVFAVPISLPVHSNS